MPASRSVPALILAASIALIGGALYFQYIIGLKPCELCLAERWPYYLAIAAAILAFASPNAASWFTGLCVLLFLGGTGLAAYHVGVEQHWIAGPTACTGSSAIAAAKTPDELRAILEYSPTRCDEVQWSLFGISLAGWNLLASLGLLVFTSLGLRGIVKEGKP